MIDNLNSKLSQSREDKLKYIEEIADLKQQLSQEHINYQA